MKCRLFVFRSIQISLLEQNFPQWMEDVKLVTSRSLLFYVSWLTIAARITLRIVNEYEKNCNSYQLNLPHRNKNSHYKRSLTQCETNKLCRKKQLLLLKISQWFTKKNFNEKITNSKKNIISLRKIIINIFSKLWIHSHWIEDLLIPERKTERDTELYFSTPIVECRHWIVSNELNILLNYWSNKVIRREIRNTWNLIVLPYLI